MKTHNGAYFEHRQADKRSKEGEKCSLAQKVFPIESGSYQGESEEKEGDPTQDEPEDASRSRTERRGHGSLVTSQTIGGQRFLLNIGVS